MVNPKALILKKFLRTNLAVAFLLIACHAAAETGAYSPFSLTLDLTGQEGFGNNSYLNFKGGVGGSLFGDWRPAEFYSLGVGVDFLDYPGNINWKVVPVDLGGRVFPFGWKKSGEGYIQGGMGYNFLNHSASTPSPGDYHLYLGLGYRFYAGGPDMALDLGAQCNYYSRLTNLPPLYDAMVKAGLTLFFGQKKPAGMPGRNAAKAPAVKAVEVAQSQSPSGTAEITFESAGVSPEPASSKTTPVPARSAGQSVSTPEASNEPAEEAAGETKTAQQTLLDAYQDGMKSYKEKVYGWAAQYLMKAVQMDDPSVPKYYKAEANAMLGLMHEFNLHQPAAAKSYYQKALRIDPTTKTAKKYIGSIKMMEDYEAGIKAFQEGKYKTAVKYLKKTLKKLDPDVPKYYPAEVNATLGVIYQFHLHKPATARRYYQEALRIDPKTKTARRHIKEVRAQAGENP